MSISLPQSPDGYQHEDFVAASLRTLGYFVETRQTLRDEGKEVLELDVVATPAGSGSPERELFEAKKDGINFSNIFKLFGQQGHRCFAAVFMIANYENHKRFLRFGLRYGCCIP